jgi:hypothetical protein
VRRPLAKLGAGSSGRRAWVGIVASGLVAMAGCSAGIGPDTERPRATIHAYETRVTDLQGQLDAQRPTLEALARTPPPPTPTPVPFVARWSVVPTEAAERRRRVGLGGELRPLVPKGIFLVVPVTVTNRTDAPAYFNPVGALLAVDDEGRRFGVDPNATSAAYVLDYGYDPGVGPRQPGVAYPDVLVFDVARGAEGFRLESTDGSVSLPIDE